jgi:hypothetical protein
MLKRPSGNIKNNNIKLDYNKDLWTSFLNWSDLCRGSEVTREKEVFVKLLKSDDAAEEYNGSVCKDLGRILVMPWYHVGIASILPWWWECRQWEFVTNDINIVNIAILCLGGYQWRTSAVFASQINMLVNTWIVSFVNVKLTY